ncbi:MAG: peptidylprolyl isomerase [Alphaproteobacteria bacterium]|nr:peptidylprolyl isomerase [Alphaproteobacteria bacterium]
MNKLYAVILIGLFFALPLQAGQIKAVVQDEIITDLDVEQRVQIMEKMFQMPADEKMKKQVLDDLINEKVKIFSAVEKGIQISDEQIKQGVSFLEQRNQMASGELEKFFKEHNLSMNSLYAQIEADIAWLHYIQSLDLKRTEITQKQINEKIADLKKQLMYASYLLGEIYIPFAGNEVAAEQEITMLFNRIVDGESFTDLAKAYSKGKTAHLMGDLGWVKSGQMEKAVDDALPEIQVGQLSKPIKGKDGFYLILMRDSQPALDSDMQEFIQASQLVLNQEDYPSLKEGLQKASENCMSFTQFAMTHGVSGSRSGALPEMMTSRLPSELRMLLSDQPVGALIGPIQMSPYLLFVMKCGVKVQSVLPDNDVVRENLQVQNMEQQAEEILQKNRKKMFVEIK